MPIVFCETINHEDRSIASHTTHRREIRIPMPRCKLYLTRMYVLYLELLIPILMVYLKLWKITTSGRQWNVVAFTKLSIHKRVTNIYIYIRHGWFGVCDFSLIILCMVDLKVLDYAIKKDILNRSLSSTLMTIGITVLIVFIDEY